MHKTVTKKLLLTLGASVLTGALLLGVNAAFGAPSDVPPGLAIWPTFSKVTVDDGGLGSTVLGTGSITLNKGGADVSLEAGADSVKFNDRLNAVNGASIGGSNRAINQWALSVGENFKVHDDWKIGEPEIVIGKDATTIVQMNGGVDFENNVTFKGGVSSPAGIDTDVGGDLLVNGLTRFGDTVNVGGDTYGAVNMNVAGNASVNGTLSIVGAASIKNLSTYDAFGSYYNPGTVSPVQSIADCGTRKVINCNAVPTNPNINILSTYISNNTCIAYGVDFVSNSGYFAAKALCLN